MKLSTAKPANQPFDALFIPVFEDQGFDSWTLSINKQLNNLLQQTYNLQEFRGQAGKFYSIPWTTTKRIVLLGLGKQADFKTEHLTKAFGYATLYARSIKASIIG